MKGLGGLNKSQNGVVVGVVQQQLPVIKTAEDLATQAKVLNDMVGRARRNMPTLDLVVFPEYALQAFRWIPMTV